MSSAWPRHTLLFCFQLKEKIHIRLVRFLKPQQQGKLPAFKLKASVSQTWDSMLYQMDCIVQTLDLKAGEFPCYCGRILCAHCAHLGNNACHSFSAQLNPKASSLLGDTHPITYPNCSSPIFFRILS